MTKKRTKAEKIGDFFDAYRKKQAGEPVRRTRAKDGSIPTHPVVEVDKDVSESQVLEECLTWLRQHHILCDRNNVGAGIMGAGGFHSYGIKHGGDIIGVLSNGIHFEIECKKGSGGRLSKGQQERWHKVVYSNGIYLVVHGLYELEYYLKDIV